MAANEDATETKKSVRELTAHYDAKYQGLSVQSNHNLKKTTQPKSTLSPDGPNQDITRSVQHSTDAVRESASIRTSTEEHIYEEIPETNTISTSLNENLKTILRHENFDKHATLYLEEVLRALDRSAQHAQYVVDVTQSEFPVYFERLMGLEFGSNQSEIKSKINQILSKRDFTNIENYMLVKIWLQVDISNVKQTKVKEVKQSPLLPNTGHNAATDDEGDYLEPTTVSDKSSSIHSDKTVQQDHQPDMLKRHQLPTASLHQGLQPGHDRIRDEKIRDTYIHPPASRHTEGLTEEGKRQIQKILSNIDLDILPSEAKICLADIMTLIFSPEVKIPFYETYIKKLIMLDYRVRDMEPLNINKSGTERTLTEMLSHSPQGTHPMDIFILTFFHCNQVLRQIMFEKLFTCKLAIPLTLQSSQFFPKSIFLWAIGGIVGEWKEIDKPKEDVLAFTPLDVISTIRLGKNSRSKSNILNDLVSPSGHDIFFNRECPLGNTDRFLTNGSIEIAFYLPSGKKDDLKNHLSMFCNLRGDALNYREEVALLKEISNSILVLVDVNQLYDPIVRNTFEKLFSLDRFLHILMIFEKGNQNSHVRFVEDILKKYSPSMYGLVVLTSAHNRAGVRIELVKSFRAEKPRTKRITLDEIAQLTTKYGYMMDNADTLVLKHRTDQCFSEVMKKETPKLELLKLQGKPWKRLTQIVRSKGKSSDQRRTKESVEEYKKSLREQRTIQQSLLTQLDSSFIDCIATLASYSANPTSFELLLRWHKIYFDKHSRKVLPKLEEEYHSIYQIYRKSIDEQKKESERIEMADELLKIEKKMEYESFGMEHIFREMGQMYEAQIGPPHPTKQLSKLLSGNVLLDIAVATLLSGHPFEIMNGDGELSNIPLQWVKAVLERLTQRIGDKTIFVLSILGVQSSGKSTFLNAMFGIQFAVSAGRCTKGIFLQLIRVQNERFQYAFIIDTEGLRANEIKRKGHDNELATIAIGLGDVTIVNIKGENNADIEDTLQITVQAFMRIKAVYPHIKLHQRCIFVHQNVGATNALQKLMVGRQKLLDSLDQITVNAATEENVVEIRQFSDIIQFDMMKDVWYFADLWYGSPPMAYVNPDYTEDVIKVRDHIFQSCVSTKRSLLRISEFAERINDLWVAILSDNFVYNFRNHLELKLYGELENAYNLVCIEMDRDISNYVFEADNKLSAMETVGQVDTQFFSIRDDLDYKCIVIGAQHKETLQKFFIEHEHADILERWREQRCNNLSTQVSAKRAQASKAVERAKENAGLNASELKTRGKFEHRLRQMATKLAQERAVKKPHSKEITNKQKNAFDSDFENLLEEIKATIPNETLHIEREVHFAMMTTASESIVAFISKEQMKTSTRHLFSKYKYIKGYEIEDISIRRHEDRIHKHEYFRRFIEFLSSIELEIENTINGLTGRKMRFDRSLAEGIFRSLMPKCKLFNKENKDRFSATNIFIAKVHLIVAHYLSLNLQVLHANYNEIYGIMARLESYRETAWNLFTVLVQQCCEEEIAAMLFCSRLKEVIEEAVNRKLYSRVCDDIKRHFHDKFSLLATMLEHLIQKDDIDRLCQYVENPKLYCLRWLDEFINILFEKQQDCDMHANQKDEGVLKTAWKAMKGFVSKADSKEHVLMSSRETTGLSEYAKEIIDVIILDIKYAIKSPHNHDLDSWLDEFHDSLCKQLAIVKGDFKQVLERNVNNINNFCEALDTRLPKLKEELVKLFHYKNATNYNWSGEVKPQQLALDALWGCDSQCPFCYEPCKLSKGHVDEMDHLCIQHKPNGLTGWHYRHNDALTIDVCSFNITTDQAFYCTPSKSRQLCADCEPVDTWQTHLFRDYKEHTVKWTIHPSECMENFYYWQYVMNRFNREIADKFGLKPANIPESWTHITKEQAIQSLYEVYRVDRTQSQNEIKFPVIK